MKNWTSEELEKLYREVNARALEDAEFRDFVVKNPKAALEQLAGEQLPDNFNLKIIFKDAGYAATYTVPDFAQGDLDAEKLSEEELSKVSGGVSFFVIVSICGAAVSVGGCGVDGCGANACTANVCGANVCGTDACGGNICGGNADATGTCAGAVCAEDACGGNAGCAGYMSNESKCGGYVGCVGDASI